jgi:hypothetical protein
MATNTTERAPGAERLHPQLDLRIATRKLQCQSAPKFDPPLECVARAGQDYAAVVTVCPPHLTLSEHKVRKNALALLTTSNTVFCCICKPLNQLGAVTTVLSADRKTR